MLKLRRCLSLLPITGIVAACATIPPPKQQPLAAYPHRHASFDLTVAWKTAQEPQGTTLEGLLRNVRYAQVDEVEVSVFLLNSRKEELARASTFLLPVPLKEGERSTFNLMLKDVTLSPGDLFRFLIRYRVMDDPQSTLKWMTTFTVDALTGAAIVPPGSGGSGF